MMVYTTAVVFCALCLVWKVTALTPGMLSGPYKIELKKLESCPDQGNKLVHFGTKLHNRGKGVYTYNGPMNFGVPLDENFKAHVDVMQFGNGGYRARFIEYTANNCEELWKLAGGFIKSLLKSAGADITKCPVPKGVYTPNHWKLQLKMDNIPTMTYNKYKVISNYYYKNVKVGCFIMYADIKEEHLSAN